MLMNQSEYARHRREKGLPGGTSPSVLFALRAGRIRKNADGLIDSEQADIDWVTNTNPLASASGVKAGAARAEQIRLQGSPRLLINRVKPRAVSGDFNKSRSAREYYDAELSRLKFEERAKSLIPLEVAKRIMFEAGRIVRAGHEDMVSQLAPSLAGESDIIATERILKRAFDEIDANLAQRILEVEEDFNNEDDEEEPATVEDRR